MATITYHQAYSALDTGSWAGAINGTGSAITISDGYHKEAYAGSFKYPDHPVVTGTITGYRYTQGDVLFTSITGLSVNATSFANLYLRGDMGGVAALLYRGADTIIGSQYADQLWGGASSDKLYGNAGNDVLRGDVGDDLLDGGSGADLMYGGQGNDTYIVDQADDLVVEDADAGIDLLKVAIATSGGTYSLSNHVENAILINSVAFNLEGNELNNQLTGNDAANTLTGHAGNDILDGKGGADLMVGGEGDDTYFVDDISDQVSEAADEGHDVVKSSVSCSLSANIEDLILLGEAANATGNDLSNTLIGNDAANIIDGGAGADRMEGGKGNDTYVVDDSNDEVIETLTAAKGGGIDTVRSYISYTLGANLENLTLVGADSIDATGNALANILDGSQNDAANQLAGMTGNDTYIVGAGDIVIEAANAGIDLVQSHVSFGLGANVENLSLLGSDDTNATGNELANTLLGNEGNNTLDGQAGTDTLKGGKGDDTYIVDLTARNTLQDSLIENVNEGNDTVKLRGGNAALATATTLTLGTNLENLDASATDLTKLNLSGNSLDNTLIGNDAANVLNGGAGIDTLIGGAGDDTYVIDNAADAISEESDEGVDLVQVAIATAGGSFTLGANLENAALTNKVAFNLIGNADSNVLKGNAANNVIDGGAGADRMEGGKGSDTYVVDDASDEVVETLSAAKGGGIDTVRSYINYTLGANLENLTLMGVDSIEATGNALANILDGSQNDAANQLAGLAGNDTYIVGSGDIVIETANAGIDLVQSHVSFELGANVENLSLLGSDDTNATGNEMANVLTGNAGNNVLDGKRGVDKLIGGAGNDHYIVDLTSAGQLEDRITEQATTATHDGGIDWVELRGLSGNTSATTITLGANLEALDASATGMSKLNLTGNQLNNVLIGNDFGNILNGGAGNDTLDGGGGDDILIGGLGADELYGRSGNDIFRFTSLKDLGLGDTQDLICDFESGDKLDFKALGGYRFVGAIGNSTDFTGIKQLGYVADGDDLVLYGNSGGDTSADFSIKLLGVSSLTTGDFIGLA